MKRILVYLYAYYPFANANTNVMQPFIDRLKKEYQVDILTTRYDSAVAKEEIINGVRIYRFDRQKFLARKMIGAGEADMHRKRTLWKAMAIVPLHYIGKTFDLFEKTDEYRTLCKLVKCNSYDLIIATCESYYSLKNVLRLKKKSQDFPKWITYFMDPHAYYIGNRKKFNSLIGEEKEIYANSDLIFTTEEIFKENRTNELREFVSKTKVIPFGNLCVRVLPTQHEASEVITCVYAGSLIDLSVRNPEYFYKLFMGLDERFRLLLICKSMNAQNKRLYDKYLRGRKNVELRTNLGLKESLDCMANADILVNFGNKTVNQTPSKIFDYISTGRPIVNFYSIETDTAASYLSNYKYKLNIFEDEAILDSARVRFVEFCVENRNKRMSADSINRLYSHYTETMASEVFLREVDLLLNSSVEND